MHDLGIGLTVDRIGEHRQRADGSLQLVGDVGDEVGAHRVGAHARAHVLGGDHRAAGGQRFGLDRQPRARRAVQLDEAGGPLTPPGSRQVRLDVLLHEHADVRALQDRGGIVAVHDLPRRRTHDDADVEVLQRIAQQRRVLGARPIGVAAGGVERRNDAFGHHRVEWRGGGGRRGGNRSAATDAESDPRSDADADREGEHQTDHGHAITRGATTATPWADRCRSRRRAASAPSR